ncbi:bifunctional DNA primase/polymerase [Nonomuraea sp. NPDC004354]
MSASPARSERCPENVLGLLPLGAFVVVGGRLAAAARAPYNIGIACGPSRLTVIDLDVPRTGGIRRRRNGLCLVFMTALTFSLCSASGQESLPLETFTVRTGRGGTHLYFSAPSDVAEDATGRVRQAPEGTSRRTRHSRASPSWRGTAWMFVYASTRDAFMAAGEAMKGSWEATKRRKCGRVFAVTGRRHP